MAELRSGQVGKSGNPLSEWTCFAAFKTLRQILEWAVANDLIVANPCARVQKHVRPKQVNRTQPRVLTPQEIDALVPAAVQKTPAYSGVIATAAYTGARIREVLGLRWGDIDHEARLIAFTRQIDLAGTTLVDLKTHAAIRVNALVPGLEPFVGRGARMKARWSGSEDFVFSACKGAPRQYRNLRRALAVAADEARLGHVRAHDLRHSATSVLLQHTDLATASKYVGHGDPSVTARVYGHAMGTAAEQAGRVAEAMKRAELGY